SAREHEPRCRHAGNPGLGLDVGRDGIGAGNSDHCRSEGGLRQYPRSGEVWKGSGRIVCRSSQTGPDMTSRPLNNARFLQTVGPDMVRSGIAGLHEPLPVRRFFLVLLIALASSIPSHGQQPVYTSGGNNFVSMVQGSHVVVYDGAWRPRFWTG